MPRNTTYHRGDVIVGLGEFIERVQKMPILLQQKILVRAARAGGELIRQEVENHAPQSADSTGRLHRDIAMSVNQPNYKRAVAKIGPGKKVFYGKFPELGTKFQEQHEYITPAFQRKLPEAFAAAFQQIDDDLRREGY